MVEYILAGTIVRFSQVVIDSAVWICVGCFIAALLKRIVGPEATRTLFGNEGRYGVLVGWIAGMLLPVCSLGAIPVIRQLYQSGVKGGTIIAFGLTAPLFNPLSILYGLTLSDPIAIIAFTFCSLLIVSALGLLWNWKWPDVAKDETTAKENTVPETGLKRSVGVVVSACEDLVGWSLLFIAVGILASTIVSVSVAKGALQTSVEPDRIEAPLFMALFVTPIYSTPLAVMSQIGTMFQHGNSVGAAFSLLILGAGANLGLLFAFGSILGFRRTLLFVAILMITTVSLAYAIQSPLYPEGVTPAGHTHAFDVYSHPFEYPDNDSMEHALRTVKLYWDAREHGATLLLLGMIVIGTALHLNPFRHGLRTWISKPAPSQSVLDIVIPNWLLGVISCIGIVAISVLGTYLYYPPPEDLLRDLTAVNADCVIAAKTGDWEAVDKWVGYCDDLSRRLEVGAFLRRNGPSDFQKAKAKAYRQRLDDLRDAINDGQTERADELGMKVANSYLQLSRAFRTESDQ